MNEAKIDKKKIIIKERLLRNNGFLIVLNDLSKPIDKRINEIIKKLILTLKLCPYHC